MVPAGLLAYLTMYLHGYFETVSKMQRYRILCDAFTIPGVVLIMFSALLLISNLGGLDGIGYSLKRMFKMLNPFAKKDMERYAEYIENRKRNRIKGYSFILISGLIFMAVALYFMFKFYSIY